MFLRSMVPRDRKREREMDLMIMSVITILLSLASSGRCSDVYTRNDFPTGFAFGSAISAYQVRFSTFQLAVFSF